jgi:predicted DNA-binding ribbon-helix-helix protein
MFARLGAEPSAHGFAYPQVGSERIASCPTAARRREQRGTCEWPSGSAARKPLASPSRSDAGICVIFATLQDSFYAATVRDKFSISMSRAYYSHGGVLMGSLVIKRSIVVAGHKTSVSLEDAFWNALKEIAKARNVTLSDLVATIDSERRHDNLSSTIRLFVLEVYRKQLFDLKEGRITESIFWAAA